MRLTPGMQAPPFDLMDGEGRPHRLNDYRGKRVILYFYPKDDTPGCTIEACDFRDRNQDLAKKGAVLLGVSADDEVSHQKFAKKYDLPFPLLSDPDHSVASSYEVWGKKKFLGREFEGIIRSTFVIGPDGLIEKAMYEVSPLGHAAEVLAGIS